MSLNFNDKVPIYIQIMDFIKKDIVTKKIKGGEKLPSVRELSSNLKVNPNTIQRAYQELERDGLTFTQRGMGTFVVEDNETILNLRKEMAKDFISNFINDMNQIGFEKNEILSILKQNLEKGGI